MTPGASSGMRPEEEEEEEEATPTSRALSHRRCKDENGPTDRTPLLLGPPAPPAGHTSTDSTTAAGAVPDRNNITGWALLRELDFYLIFLFNGLCAGVGLCCKSLYFGIPPLAFRVIDQTDLILNAKRTNRLAEPIG